MRKTYCRDTHFDKNVDFDKLNKILHEKGISRAELSRESGHCKSYVKDNVFARKRLSETVADVLQKKYGVHPDEYKKTGATASNDDITETTASNDRIYKYTFSFNGEFLERLALASLKEHMSIDAFVEKCLVEGIGDKIIDADDDRAKKEN